MRRLRRWELALIGIVFLLLLIASVAVMWVALERYVRPADVAQRNEFARTVLQVFVTAVQVAAGGVLLAGLYFTQRTLHVSQRTLQVNLESQITERFTRAIEQLGSVTPAVRLGGIYALERIAHDSTTDYWTVMEVLTAYLKEQRLWSGPLESQPIPRIDLPNGSHAFDPPELPTDILAVLRVLGRRPQRYRQGELHRLSLSLIDLRRAFLDGAHLEGAVFHNAHLEGAFFPGANLTEARFNGAYLEGTVFTEAQLRGVTFGSADMNGACFDGADLREAHFGDAADPSVVQHATFRGAQLAGADLRHALNLTVEQLRDAHYDMTTLLPRGFSKSFA